MIALCVTLLVVSSTVTLLMRQQRFYRSVGDVLTVRTSMRDGVDILTADLRTASIQDTVRLAADTAIEFFSTIGASTLCADPTGDRIIIPAETLPSGNILTAWSAMPDSDDFVAVYHDSLAIAPAPGWQRFRITGMSNPPAATACAPATAIPSLADLAGGARAYEITLAPSVIIAARRGAPVRVMRHARYSVYRAGDRKWYLGYRRCASAGCVPIQPVSGPYDGGDDAPLELRYYTGAGVRIPTPASSVDVARIDIVLRAASAAEIAIPGLARAVLRDSLLATVTPRNGP
ncbi:MAG: hypothetical protein ACR2MQ_06765 [Gemmatimonadaceae bacterium]